VFLSRITRQFVPAGIAVALAASATPLSAQSVSPEAAISGTGATDTTMVAYPVAVLQALDKVTGRISTLETPVGERVDFGTLSITPRTCMKRPPEEQPESAAFLEIDDEPPAGRLRRVFTGWMFASSPAVSAMEHPVFDVWVKDCARPAEPEDKPAAQQSGG
jgi:hypothetical protein